MKTHPAVREERRQKGRIPDAGSLLSIYERLYERFGPQGWWPGDTAAEVIVGAILTQNTSWRNVEKAIQGLKREGLLSIGKLAETDLKVLGRVIRSSGYYRVKARRLRNSAQFIMSRYRGSIARMRRADTALLRRELLSVNGIGNETADSILLYALGKPVFVVDAYTRRIFSRHGYIAEDASYEELQRLFAEGVPADTKRYNEYHALIVKLGNDLCKKSAPRCGECPLGGSLRRVPVRVAQDERRVS